MALTADTLNEYAVAALSPVAVNVGPLGVPSRIGQPGKVVLVGGGLGVAPVYPQLRQYRQNGNTTVSIIGFRNHDLVFWEDRFRRFSSEGFRTPVRRPVC